ncbi:hypothetical protein [Photobacterium galatheae]|uniref:TM2 domain-containing protein n=1 Tax=Photobacterium galatheae TaxID=1654360 RepID=A0A066RIT2_9GAMM|nr:hypothetical protein [Photobacterium galatheae]KDM90355.1 hypothetical protein EA58_17825 [Photobacterium galatheae]MCM0150767.1 hypothetical protein [Photobacterium galatheae]
MNDSIKMAKLNNQMKNPVVALALGFFIPGAAQMYAGSVLWGVINLVIIVVCAITVIASPVSFVLWLVSMFMGYKGTKKFNDNLLSAAEASN